MVVYGDADIHQIHHDCYEIVSNGRRRQLLFALLEGGQLTDSPRELDHRSASTATGLEDSVEQYHVTLPAAAIADTTQPQYPTHP